MGQTLPIICGEKLECQRLQVTWASLSASRTIEVRHGESVPRRTRYDLGMNVILSPSASLRTGFAKNLKIVFRSAPP